jgi:energy-coupling factor transporter ATP-binding protein EcfA2
MRLEAVGKRYGIRQPWVVRGVTADLPAGRLIRVSWRNRSGKSTLLVAAGGTVLFVDHDQARLAGGARPTA